jgi:hypothetical protein
MERKSNALIRRMKLSAVFDANDWCDEWSFWCMLNHAAGTVMDQAYSDTIIVW